eukprot:11218392-Lingulodinium_polyedra.AAC.1
MRRARLAPSGRVPRQRARFRGWRARPGGRLHRRRVCPIHAGGSARPAGRPVKDLGGRRPVGRYLMCRAPRSHQWFY